MKYLGGKFDSLSSIVIYNHAKYLIGILRIHHQL